LAVALTLLRGESSQRHETNLRHKAFLRCSGDFSVCAFCISVDRSAPFAAAIFKFIVAIVPTASTRPLLIALNWNRCLPLNQRFSFRHQASRSDKGYRGAAYLSTRVSPSFLLDNARSRKWCQRPFYPRWQRIHSRKRGRRVFLAGNSCSTGNRTRRICRSRSGLNRSKRFRPTLFLSCIGQRVKLGMVLGVPSKKLSKSPRRGHSKHRSRTLQVCLRQ